MKKTTLFICAALLAGAVQTAPAQEAPDLKGGPMGVERIAKLANYSVYSSVPADSPADTCWMQVDLGRSYPIEQVNSIRSSGTGGWPYGAPDFRYASSSKRPTTKPSPTRA